MKKVLFLIMVMVLLAFPSDFNFENLETSRFEKKVNESNIVIDVKKAKRDSSWACFLGKSPMNVPDLIFTIKVDNEEIWIPREMYCILTLISEIDLSYKNGFFYIDGISGEGGERSVFEMYFNKTNVVKSFVFENESKRDTISACFYKPVFWN